jgi:hypothetical protein
MTTQKKYKLKGGNPFSRFFRKKYNSQNTDYQPEIIKEDNSQYTDNESKIVTENLGIIALIDVDDTLIKGSYDEPSYNDNLIRFLLKNNIINVYLFTTMSFKIPDLIGREQVIKYLKTIGITVLGVITPGDFVWNMFNNIVITDNQIEYDFKNTLTEEDAKYTIMPKGTEETQLIPLFNKLNKLQLTNDDIYDYMIKNNTIGNAYKMVIDIYKEKQHDKDIENIIDVYRTKSFFALDFTTLLKALKKYPNEKGPIMDLFLSQCPSWVHSILVIDDNPEVINTIKIISAREQNKIIITPISIRKTDFNNILESYYDKCLIEHMNKVKELITKNAFISQYPDNLSNQEKEVKFEHYNTTMDTLKQTHEKNLTNSNPELQAITRANAEAIEKMRSPPIKTKKWYHFWKGGKRKTRKNKRKRTKKVKKYKRRR